MDSRDESYSHLVAVCHIQCLQNNVIGGCCDFKRVTKSYLCDASMRVTLKSAILTWFIVYTEVDI